jgi:D-alanyl-D-alanine carboxypeptidase
MYGAMLPSGNDSAYTLAEYFGYLQCLCSRGTLIDQNAQHLDLTSTSTTGYVHEFISSMNQRAMEMELLSTRFSNPHGLQNAMNVSSARDMVKLSVQASSHPLFRTIMSTVCHRYEVYEDVFFRKRTVGKWWNTNRLLKEDWEGVKTGQTTSAGSCLSSLKQGIFIVVLNCSSAETRFSDTEKIYSWYLEQQCLEQKVQTIKISKLGSRRRIKTEFSSLEVLPI